MTQVPADPQDPRPLPDTPVSRTSRPVVPEDQDQVLAQELAAFPAEDEPIWEELEYLEYLADTAGADDATADPAPHPSFASGVGRAGAGFAHGGVADMMVPGPVLADLADQAWQQGLGGLDDDQLTGVLAAWQRLGARAAAGLLSAASELAARRAILRRWRAGTGGGLSTLRMRSRSR
jgi:hypothetical protein